tara:strand:- start:1145 stop:1486 length:342 start_codon:yes stop_codon:yes gene_type:complete
MFVGIFYAIYTSDDEVNRRNYKNREKEKCWKCNGNGKCYPLIYTECLNCDGTGNLVKNTWLDKNGNTNYVFREDSDGDVRVCETCYGKKTILTDDYSKGKEKCYICEGTGMCY